MWFFAPVWFSNIEKTVVNEAWQTNIFLTKITVILTTPERSLRPFARPKSSFGGGSATRVRKVSLLDPFMPPLTKGSTAFLSMQKKMLKVVIKSQNWKLGYNNTQCLKIAQKVAFNIASEASYVYILSGQNFIKNAKNGQFWRNFENLKSVVKQCYQIGHF